MCLASTNNHVEICMAAIAAGKHVFCEKPVAREVKETVAIMKAAEESSADIVAGSALMTTTLKMQQRMVKAANEEGSTVMMIFGGAPCSKEWVEKIGGDGYSASGTEIVTLVNSLMSRKSN